LNRDQLGTSILIPWFFEPKEEEPRPLTAIAEDTARSIRKWFWPSLVEGRLRADVRVFERGAALFESEVVADDSVRAFVAAWSDPITGERAIEPDELAERIIGVTPPILKAAPDESGREGAVILRVQRTGDLTPEPDEEGERVALVRGAFMVVEYWKPKGAQFGGDGWVGVMKAGLARGDETSDDDIEAFLRAAEPPAHDKWEKGTNRLQSEYRRGAGATLETLFGKASLLVTEMSRPEPADSVLGPQRLAKLLRLPGTGPPKSERYSVTVEEQALEYPLWTATAVVKGPRNS
jgi:RNA polymerase primary sigma factor